MKVERTEKAKQQILFGIIFALMGAYGTFQLITGRVELTADATSYFPLFAPILTLIGLGSLFLGFTARPQTADYVAPEPLAQGQSGPLITQEQGKFLVMLASGFDDSTIQDDLRLNEARLEGLRRRLFHAFDVNRDSDLIYAARKKGYIPKA